MMASACSARTSFMHRPALRERWRKVFLRAKTTSAGAPCRPVHEVVRCRVGWDHHTASPAHPPNHPTEAIHTYPKSGFLGAGADFGISPGASKNAFWPSEKFLEPFWPPLWDLRGEKNSSSSSKRNSESSNPSILGLKDPRGLNPRMGRRGSRSDKN